MAHLKAYIKVPLKNIVTIQKIVTLIYSDFSPSYQTLGESHDFWEMVYVDRGELYLQGGDQERLVKQGQILFHQPNEFHRVCCDGTHAASVFIVSFDCRSPAMRFFHEKLVDVPRELLPLLQILTEECTQSFHLCTHPLQQAENAPIGGQQLIRNYLECFLIRIMRHYSDESNTQERFFPSQEHLESSLAEDIEQYLRAHLQERITLDRLCDEFHFGTSTLCNVFKKKTGKSILHYFLELKIEEAKRLLYEDRITVTEISEHLGFENPQYFSRIFRQYVGVCPREFRTSLSYKAGKHLRKK